MRKRTDFCTPNVQKYRRIFRGAQVSRVMLVGRPGHPNGKTANGEISIAKKRLLGVMGDPPILAPSRALRCIDQFPTFGALDVRLCRHLRRSRDPRRAISMPLLRLLSKGSSTPSRQRQTILHQMYALVRKVGRRSLCQMCFSLVHISQ